MDGLVSANHPGPAGSCRAGRDAGAGKKRARDDERIELSVAELRRLLQALREPEEQRGKRLWWSRFRRMHQAVAQRCHRARRARQAPLPSPTNLRPIRVLGLRSEEHTSELQSHLNLVCRLLLEKKKNSITKQTNAHHVYSE